MICVFSWHYCFMYSFCYLLNTLTAPLFYFCLRDPSVNFAQIFGFLFNIFLFCFLFSLNDLIWSVFSYYALLLDGLIFNYFQLYLDGICFCLYLQYLSWFPSLSLIFLSIFLLFCIMTPNYLWLFTCNYFWFICINLHVYFCQFLIEGFFVVL